MRSVSKPRQHHQKERHQQRLFVQGQQQREQWWWIVAITVLVVVGLPTLVAGGHSTTTTTTSVAAFVTTRSSNVRGKGAFEISPKYPQRGKWSCRAFHHNNNDKSPSESDRANLHNNSKKNMTPRAMAVASAIFLSTWLSPTAQVLGVLPPPTFSPPWQERRHAPTFVPKSLAAATLASAETSSTTTTDSSPPLPPGATVDEIARLISKFYVDRTFHDQDWTAVTQSYRVQVQPTTSPSDELKIATRLVQTLGDKYSRVIDPQAYARIQKFDLIGIGAVLMPEETSGRIAIGAPPVPESPADRAGLRAGDVITSVNGVSTEGRTAFDIIDQLMEQPNAQTITLTTLRNTPATTEPTTRTVTLHRQFAQVQDPVRARITERREDGTVVAYVRITEFNALVKPRLQQVLSDLEQREGANAYVLDVRSNPGGAFQSAVNIASLFLDHAVATRVVAAEGDADEVSLWTTAGQVVVDPTHPVVLWIDGQSASATEVLAGALQDNCRALVMGDSSYGKGWIQAVYGLKSGAGLVLTVARYITPGGNDIQGSGITPNQSAAQGGVASSFLPLSLMDTSHVNFQQVQHQLQPPLCQPPPPPPPKNSAPESKSNRSSGSGASQATSRNDPHSSTAPWASTRKAS